MSLRNNRHLSFPFRIGDDGRTVQVSSLEEHVKDEIIQLILTNPGERLFLPEYGGGVKLFVFRNFDEPTMALAKTALTNNLTTWLKDRIVIDNLNLEVENEKINVTLKYRVKEIGEPQELSFETREG